MLILPVGIPGCGKSTLAQMLVEAEVIHNDAIVSPDRYRELLTGTKANQEVNPQAWTITRIMASNRLWYGQDVYLDATNVVRKNFGEYSGIAREAGHKIVYVWFGNKAEAVERNAARTEHRVPDEPMDRMVNNWMQAHQWLPKNDEHTVVWNHDDPDLIEKINGVRDPKEYK